MSKQTPNYGHIYQDDIAKLVEPVYNGSLNPCYRDSCYRRSLEEKHGKEAVKKAIKEYEENKRKFPQYYPRYR